MGFSNIGFLTSTLRYLNNNQRLFERADYQLATGHKYSRLQDYGRLSNRILDLQLVVGQYESYKESIKHTKVDLEAYNSSLTALDDLASQMMRWAVDIPSDTTDVIWSQNTEAFIRGAILGIQEELNTEIAGRYIYGGSNANRPPIKTLTELSLFGAADAFTHDADGKKIHITTPIETGDTPTLLGRVPQYRYSSQDLANIKHMPDFYLQAGANDTFYVDPSVFTRGSADTLKIRVTMPGGGALPSWIQYNADLKRVGVQLPAGTAAPTAIQVQAENNKGEIITQLVNIHPSATPDAIPTILQETEASTYVAGRAIDDLTLLTPTDIGVGSAGAGPVTANIPIMPTTTSSGYVIPAGTFTVAWTAADGLQIGGTPPNDMTGDVEFDVEIRDAAGNTRAQQITLLGKYAKEYDYDSYLTAWDPGPTQPTGFAVEPTVPITIDEKLWEKPKVSIAKTMRVDFGMTAASPAFQKLIDAALRLKSAAQDGLTSEQRASFIRAAKGLAEEARQGITSLLSANNSNRNVFEQRDILHTRYKNYAQGELDDIRGISASEATAELVNIQAMITSSYSMIAKRQEMSLAKYL